MCGKRISIGKKYQNTWLMSINQWKIAGGVQLKEVTCWVVWNMIEYKKWLPLLDIWPYILWQRGKTLFSETKSILLKHESCLSLCLFVYVFQSHKNSQLHEILALGLIQTNLIHDEARFSKFWFLRGGLPIWSSVKKWVFRVFFENLSHFNT